jgi:hypothetical protein
MRRRLSAALSELLRHLPANDSSRKYAAMLIKLERNDRPALTSSMLRSPD